MRDSILEVLNYYHFFSYPPTIHEVYAFLNTKISKRDFNTELDNLINKQIIYKKNQRLACHESHFKSYEDRVDYSQYLYTNVNTFLPFLQFIPTVRYVGISGSLSMSHVSKQGDIDIFIITSHNALWITRCVVLIYKYIIKLIHNRIGSKFCFNLFFSETGLTIPQKKQNIYIGHEILQLKTVIDKNNWYGRLLAANDWIYTLFPNNLPKTFNFLHKRIINNSKSIRFIEEMLRFMQIKWLLRNKLNWKETDNQLWLIQNDFGKKVLSNKLKK